MRALNVSLIVLFATASSLALTGCLGTNTPANPPSLINESASGTGYVLARGAGFEDMATTIGTSSAIGTDGPAVFTAYTNSGTGAFGFIANLPADATASGVADTAVIPVGSFTAAPEKEFPAGTVEASVATYPTATSTVSPVGVITSGTTDGNILVDKFGTSQALQYSDYGIWAENGATAGLSPTAASTVSAFAVGIPTTIMPTSGTAIYNGGAAGVATNATGGGEFSGTAQLTANFTVGGGTISGTITGINYLSSAEPNVAGNVGTMNNIDLNGGTIAGNTFTGTPGASNVGGAPAAGPKNLDITGATGTFGGAFNGGLTAAEVAGTFHLSTGSGAATTNVVGAFGAHTP